MLTRSNAHPTRNNNVGGNVNINQSYSNSPIRRGVSTGCSSMYSSGDSKASLQNNIGALMLQKNSIHEAKHRFQAAIRATNDTTHQHTNASSMEIQGLTWFHNKLRWESTSITHDTSVVSSSSSLGSPDRRTNHATTITATHMTMNMNPPISSTTSIHINGQQQHHHHHPMASWNHNIERYIPLGLEFISLPIHLHATTMGDTNDTANASNRSSSYSPIRDARCAAYLNLARIRLEFPQESSDDQDETDDTTNGADKEVHEGGGGGIVEDVLTLCLASLENIVRNPTTNTTNTDISTTRSPLRRSQSERARPSQTTTTAVHTNLDMNIDMDTDATISPSLEVIARNNVGVLLFSLNRFEEALQQFESAFDIITNAMHTSSPTPSSSSPSSSSPHPPISQDSPESYPVLPYNYLHLITLFNLSRTCIRMKELERARSYINKISNLPSNLILTPTIPSSPHHRSSYSSSSHHHHHQHLLHHRYKHLISLSKHYHEGLLQQRQEHLTPALEHYNAVLSLCRRELGHYHIYNATVLEKKAKVLFDQHNLPNAFLSYLAALRVYDYQFGNGAAVDAATGGTDGGTDGEGIGDGEYLLERSRILYEIGRTLHDREEYSDALRMYKKALALRLQHSDTVDEIGATVVTHATATKDAIKILTNIGRMHHIMRDLDGAVKVNLQIVNMAIAMVGGGRQQQSQSQGQQHIASNDDDEDEDDDDDIPLQHAFVRNQFVVLGNLYVEARRLDEAMEVFSKISRQQLRSRRRRQRQRQRAAGEGGSDDLLHHARPEEEDVDTSSAFAVKVAERLGNVGGNGTYTAAAA
eukprot:CAMPEP_0198260166 /NCGR_PEP_ID=MMETSP1447-20131203/9206_1 /TAXON_ID=420782 /ORGANISM="Chaetoceros dichaeta, Strain CCMP1751" /LENGTH=814 /DNA_ID=CAMNT_0043947757 /DNA_START=348 /DNA_END=2792 /DNA_ORIENTATION=+